MATLVLESTIAVQWLLMDREKREGDGLFRRVVADGALVPVTFRSDVIDGLHSFIRAKKLGIEQTREMFEWLDGLNVKIIAFEGTQIAKEILGCCVQFNLFASDASYLWLAANQKLPLATGQEGLRNAALSLGVLVLPDLQADRGSKPTVH